MPHAFALAIQYELLEKLVHIIKGCYCRDGLENTEFQQFPLGGSSIPPLPLPPLPLGHPSQFGALEWVPVRRKPRVWMVFVVFLAAIAAMLGSSVFVIFVYQAIHRQADSGSVEGWQQSAVDMVRDPAGLISLGIASQLSILIVTLCAAWLSPVGVVRRLRLRASSLSWVGFVIVPIGMLGLAFLLDAMVRLLHIPQGGSLEVFHDVFPLLSPVQLIVAVIVIGIMPGIGEEFMFRGYMQSRLTMRWGKWIAILVSAFFFGLAHFDWLQSSFTFVMGIYLGYMAEQSGSIRPTMFCHMFNNTVVLLMTRFAAGGDEAAVPPSMTASALQALVAAGVLGLCCLYLRFRVHPPAADVLDESQDAPLAMWV